MEVTKKAKFITDFYGGVPAVGAEREGKGGIRGDYIISPCSVIIII